MAATALLKFKQGLNVGPPGEALKGVIGTSVDVENSDNTDVKSWQIDLVYSDPASGIVASTPFAFNNNSSSPHAVFIPDVRGSSRWVLKVWDVVGRVGNPSDIDIRVFTVPEASGLIIPPTQIWPLPLPVPASGLPTAKPHEQNYGGQPDGWAGNGAGDGGVNDLIRRVGALLAAFTSIGSNNVANQSGVPGTTVTDALNALNISGLVSSVFGRAGIVVAQASDYKASQVDNDSSVAGTFVRDALNSLLTITTSITSSIGGLVTGVSSVFGRSGAVVAQAGDYTSAQVNNTSTVSGATVTAALNTLSSAIPIVTSTAPSNVQKQIASAGVSVEAARADHKHQVGTDVAVGLSVGGASAEGTAATLARSDHTHALPAFGATAGTIAQGNDGRFNDDRIALALRSATTVVAVSAATAPAAGQVLAATDPTHATWQTLAVGNSVGSTAPSDVQKQTASAGVSIEAARVDHKHQIATAAAAAQAPGDTVAEGTATTLARSDHKHSLPAFGVTTGTFCQGNDGRLSDDRTASGLRTTTTVVNCSNALVPSAGQVLTATDGTHATWQSPATVGSTAPSDVQKQTAAAGASTELARADHKHQVATAAAVAQAPGDAAAEGTATTLARSDHKHALPAFGATAGTFTQGNDTRLSDDRTASGLRTTTTVVNCSSAVAPAAGQVLTATDSTHATWQTLAAAGTTAPSDVLKQTAAAGVSTELARVDHKHQVQTAAAGAATPGDAAAEGTATTLARSDHKHALPAFGVAAGTFCQGNDGRLSNDRTASGLRSATTVVSVSAATAPTTGQALVATDGTHATWQAIATAGATAPQDILKQTASAGVAAEVARVDHKHQVVTASAVSLAVGGASAEGTSTSLARSDHTHALPAFGTTSGTFAQGNDARLSDDRTASSLRTATQVVAIASTSVTAVGQALVSTSGTTATWQGVALSSRQVIAGTGLTGTGNLASDVTLSVAFGITSTTACVGNDTRLSNNRTASGLQNALNVVALGGTTPTAGQALIASSGTMAFFQDIPIPTLTQVLTSGNSTGGHDLAFTSGDHINASAAAGLKVKFGGVATYTFEASMFRLANSNGIAFDNLAANGAADIFADGNVVQSFYTGKNIDFFGASVTNFQGGSGIFQIFNCTTQPTAGSPTGGGFLYVVGGEITWKSSSGVVTTLSQPPTPTLTQVLASGNDMGSYSFRATSGFKFTTPTDTATGIFGVHGPLLQVQNETSNPINGAAGSPNGNIGVSIGAKDTGRLSYSVWGDINVYLDSDDARGVTSSYHRHFSVWVLKSGTVTEALKVTDQQFSVSTEAIFSVPVHITPPTSTASSTAPTEINGQSAVDIGSDVRITAGSGSSGTSSGGSVVLKPGTGNTNGELIFQDSSGTVRLQVNGAGVTLDGTLSSRLVPYTVSTSVNIDLTGNASMLITVFMDSSGAARSAKLPSPSIAGRRVTVKDSTGSAGTNNITVTRQSAETLEGLSADYALAAAWQSVTLISNGTNWFIC